MKLHVSLAAAAEVKEVVAYFEKIRPGLGEAFSILYEERLQSIIEGPESFPKLIDLPEDLDIRFTELRRFRYVIYFEIRAEEITVLAVAHGSRKPHYWFPRRHEPQ